MTHKVLLLDSDIFKAFMHPISVPRDNRENGTRPDLSSIGWHEGSDFFDVTIVSCRICVVDNCNSEKFNQDTENAQILVSSCVQNS